MGSGAAKRQAGDLRRVDSKATFANVFLALRLFFFCGLSGGDEGDIEESGLGWQEGELGDLWRVDSKPSFTFLFGTSSVFLSTV